jgi:hypothetical protein
VDKECAKSNSVNLQSAIYPWSRTGEAVPGMLGFYDLPDLAASLAPRVLMLANVVDGTGTTDDREKINKELSIIRAAYRNMDSSGSLIIETGRDLNQFFKEWIK